MISIVIPTIQGREHWLDRAVAAYERTTNTDHELIVIRDKPTCGQAWNEGIAQAQGDYIHLSADDLEPHDGWWGPAKYGCDGKVTPAPMILNTDGSLQSCGGATWQPNYTGTPFTRIPFLNREMVEAVGHVPEIHYYTDNWISYQCLEAGYPTMVIHEYLFTHHFAPEGRVDDRFGVDGMTYQELTA